MGTEYGELLAEFDLGFLNNSNNEVPNNSERLEKQKKAILIAKRKTIATDSLLKKYYEKKEALDIAEKALFESKMECKQVCIEYRNAVEQNGTLEESERKLQEENRNLEDRYILLESQYSALKSHTYQLQELVKAHEKKITTLKSDTETDKFVIKESEKKIADLEKIELSLKDLVATLKDIVVGKGVLDHRTKLRLKQFSKSVSIKVNDSECEDNYDDCDWINDDADDVEISQGNDNNSLIKITNKEENHVKVYTEIDRCAEISSSVDTGRGSSLASDREKCIYSPDHGSNDSMIDIHPPNRREQVKCQDAATSPIAFASETEDITPIAFTLQTERITPINICEPAVDTMKKPYNVPPLPANKIQDKDLSEHLQMQKECLEVNGKKASDNYDDTEVSSILKEIQLHFDLVTPIPATPSASIRANAKDDNCHIWVEVEKLREEFKSSLADHAKQVLEIQKTNKADMGKLELEIKKTNKADMEKLELEIKKTNKADMEKLALETKKTNKADLEKQALEIKTTIVADLPKQVSEIMSQNKGVDAMTASAKATQCVGSNKDKVVAEDFECDNYAAEIAQNVTELDNRPEDSTDDEFDTDLVRIPSRQSSVAEEVVDECNPTNKDVTKIAERIRFLDSSDNNDEERLENVPVNICDKSKTCDIEIHVEEVNVDEEKVKKKQIRKARITKLEKMRLRLQPKSKIKTPLGPSIKKKKTSLKTLPNAKQVNKHIGDSRNLNDKAVYEKALAVVAEIRAKNKQEQERVIVRRTLPPRKARGSRETMDDSLEKTPDKPIDAKRDTRFSQLRVSIDRLPLDSIGLSPEKYGNKAKCDTNSLSPQQNVFARSSSDATSLTPRTTRSKTKGIGDNKFEDRWNKAPAKRPSTEDFTPDTSSKRQLRSSLRTSNSANSSMEVIRNSNKNHSYSTPPRKSNRRRTSYAGQDLFELCDKKDEADDKPIPAIQKEETPAKPCKDKEDSMKHGILCRMIDKYGVRDYRKKQPRKVPDHVIEKVFKTITRRVEDAVNAESYEAKTVMNSLVNELKNLEYKTFMLGFMKYLQHPDRNMELLSMTCTPPLPPMSKTEQVLLYVISQLNHHWPDINLTNEVLQNIEYHIFRLNKTPDFASIDTLSHLYAVLCRFSKAKNKLRLFMLDAMYCVGYKAVPLIRQCINVWMHVLPLPHMRSAKNPLVMCLIYLLHFYRCEDKFKKVQEMRSILQRKYSYDLSEWNENTIKEQFRTSIMDMRDNKTELSILRIAIIIYAKRLGARWCEKNIIKNLLVPIITNENNSERVRRYCISLLGPLVRPFPPEMKVNSEIIMNQLIDMLDQNLSHTLQEAVYSSLLYINKHDHRRVTRALLNWKPKRPLSPDLELLLRNFVRDRPVQQWVEILSRHNS